MEHNWVKSKREHSFKNEQFCLNCKLVTFVISEGRFAHDDCYNDYSVRGRYDIMSCNEVIIKGIIE